MARRHYFSLAKSYSPLVFHAIVKTTKRQKSLRFDKEIPIAKAEDDIQQFKKNKPQIQNNQTVLTSTRAL